MSVRRASVVRTTDQTEVRVALDLDGSGRCSVQTGVPSLDHALTLFARYGTFDLDVQSRSGEASRADSMGEVGFCLGLALDKALGDRQGIPRLGHCCAPVDDHLARAVVEISGHPYLAYHVHVPAAPAGSPDTSEWESFWRAFVAQARMNLHVELLHGDCGLPALEAVFKAAGHALRDACRR
jgi:imidazoleglycerol-phosphate dehydratase